jgi:hypothetical protein
MKTTESNKIHEIELSHARILYTGESRKGKLITSERNKFRIGCVISDIGEISDITTGGEYQLLIESDWEMYRSQHRAQYLRGIQEKFKSALDRGNVVECDELFTKLLTYVF